MKTKIIDKPESGKKPRRKKKFKFPLDDRILSGYPDGIINPFTQAELYDNIRKAIEKQGEKFQKNSIMEIKHLKGLAKGYFSVFELWHTVNNYFLGAKYIRVIGAETVNYYLTSPRYTDMGLAKLTVPKPKTPKVTKYYGSKIVMDIDSYPECFNLSILIDKMYKRGREKKTQGFILPLSINDKRIPSENNLCFGHIFRAELKPATRVLYSSGSKSKKKYFSKIDRDVFGKVIVYM